MKAVEEESGRLSPAETRSWGDVKKGYTPFQEGDVLFAKITPCMENGKYAIAKDLHEGRAAGSTEFHVFRPSAQLDAQYLLNFLFSHGVRQAARMNMRGAAGQLRVPTSFFEELEIPLAPLPDQQRIVAEIEKQFTRLEAGLAGLRRVQANLKRYRAAVLRFAFGGKLLAKDNDWPTTTLGEVCTVLSGYGFPERFQGRSSGDVGFYKVGDISAAWQRGERVLTQANHYISHAETQELRAKPLPAGTVVFAKIGAAIALNRRAILGQPSLVDNNVMGLLAGNKVDPAFLFYFTCTLRLNDLARATTVPSIRKGDVENITLDLPPLTEQHRIVTEVERRLSVIDELEAVVTANLQRATRLRQSILQRAFTGELV